MTPCCNRAAGTCQRTAGDKDKDNDMSEKTYIIKRDGQLPLRFKGILIVETANRHHSGDRANRWLELTLYRTDSGKWVIAAVRRTCWDGERDRHGACVCISAQGVVDWLRSDGDGTIGDLSNELLKRAADVEPEFAGVYVEDV